jgi:hypothetical protein
LENWSHKSVSFSTTKRIFLDSSTKDQRLGKHLFGGFF